MMMKLLTIKEAAGLIEGLTIYRLRELVKEGQLPHFKFGNKIVINSDILLDFFSTNPIQYNSTGIRSPKKGE